MVPRPADPQDYESRYRLLAENISDVIWVLDLDTRQFLFISSSVERLTGFTVEEARLQPLPESVFDRARCLGRSGPQTFVDLLEQTCKNGSPIWVENSLRYVTNPQNGHGEVYGVSRDVTARRRDLEALKASEERFRNILQDIVSVSVQGYGPDGTTRYWNLASEKLYGYTADEAVGRNLLELIIPPPMREGVAEAIQYMAATGEPIPASELVLMRKDGSPVSVFSSHTIVRVPGRDQELFCLDIDMTARNQAEESLRDALWRLESIVEGTHVGTWEWNVQTGQVVVNDIWARMLGYTPEELAPTSFTTWEGLTHAEDLPRAEGVIQRHFAGEAPFYDVEFRMRHRDGHWVWVQARGRLSTRSPDGKPLMMFGTHTDITERKTSEATLLRTQKLESIGTLAGGIAHDFNNLLAAILGQSSMALGKLKPDHAAAENLRRALKAAEHAADLTRQLLAYSGKGKFLNADFSLNRLINDNREMLALSIPKTAALVVDLVTPGPLITGDVGQIQQVVMNLIINAGEALGGGAGTITLATTTMDGTPGERYQRYTANALLPGAYVKLSVADTGSGMDIETQNRIFDPFFTTKFTGRGLGLAAVLGIIRGHGGGLHLESEPGRGTRFEVLLPLVGTEEPSSQAFSDSGPSPGIRHLLVIDDDEFMLEFLEEILKMAGHRVALASDALQGLELVQRGTTPDLVILDYSMPHMNGRVAFEELRQLRPGIQVLLSSGYSEEETLSSFGTDRPAGFLQKPYSPEKLLALVEVLTAPRK